MNSDIDRVLGRLAGLPLSKVQRDADTIHLRFGAPPAARRGGAPEEGELTLRVACPWRLADAERVLVGSGDLFTPADPDEDPATFDWEAPGASWLDVRLAELAARRAGDPFVVESAAADRFGGVRIALRGGVVLELFPNSTPTGHVATEFWRLGRDDGREDDWVVGTFGVEREPAA